jgi:hypothetical protein
VHRSVVVVLGALTLSLAAANAAVAQKKPDDAAPRRQGFWFGLGAAAGSVGMDCSICSSKRLTGGAGYVRLGGTLSPHWLLGGEIDGWARSESGVDRAVANVAITASWYPSRTGGFFLKFGLGALTYRSGTAPNNLEMTGASGIFGLGYDVPIGRSLSLTPFLNSIATSKSKLKVNGSELTGVEVNPNLVQFGLALSWH